MEAFLEHLRSHGDTAAFIQGDREISFHSFVEDVQKTTKEIAAQKPFGICVFEWDYAPEYRNIVLLFAFAVSNGIVVPRNSTSRLFANQKKVTIFCFNEEVTVFCGIRNIFTQELERRKTPGIIMSTSGTGNTPRDILVDFRMLAQKYLGLKTKYRMVMSYSLEHNSGIETLLNIITPGGTVILVPSLDPYEIAMSLRKNRASLISCSPTFLTQLYLKGLLNEEYLETVDTIVTSGEPLTDWWAERFATEIPRIKIRQAFGTTETSAYNTQTHAQERNKFMPGKRDTDYRVENNILFLKNRYFMLGNWNENEIITNTWIETSDIVVMDEEGFIKVTGRKEKLIAIGDRKVDPQNIEHVLMGYTGIRYAKVHSETNPITGQMIVADVISDEEDPNLKNKLQKYCLEKLEEYKVPSRINILKEVPMTHRFKNKTT